MLDRYRCSTSPRVAVCLYGAVRDVAHTRPTHVYNVRNALGKSLGGVDVFVHALLLPELDAPRNGAHAFLGLGEGSRRLPPKI